MRKKLISLLFLIFISLTGCSARADVSPEPEEVVQEDSAVEEAAVEEPEAVEAETDEDAEADADDAKPDDAAKADDADAEPADEAAPKEYTYTERAIGEAFYTVPDEWYLKERDDRGPVEHTYYESGSAGTQEFLAIWYVPLWEKASTTAEFIDQLLDITESDQNCDSFKARTVTLDNGIEASKYQYSISVEDYEESGYYIPVNEDGILMVFYDPRLISDDRYLTEEIDKIANSVRVPEVKASAEADAKEAETAAEDPAAESSVPETKPEEASATQTADQSQPQPQAQSTSVPNDGGHNYYKNVPADGVAAAEAVASQIAASIMADPSYATDLQRVSAAARIVSSYCNNCQYGSDSTKYYRSPYGVFVAGVYTCAGSTRALGRVLDYMGYPWQHHNENQNSHQWCILTMDGQTGFADGMGGFAGYGAMTNGMTLPDGSQIYFAE